MLRSLRAIGGCGIAALVLWASAAIPAGQIGGRPTRPQIVPPKGPARHVIFQYCTSCHGIDDYAYYAQDRAAWDSLITAKHRGLAVPLPEAAQPVRGASP